MAYRIGIIGGGNMGSVIARGSVAAKILLPQDIIVAEPDPSKRAAITQLGCDATDDPLEVVDAEQIILAVKPQSFVSVADAIAPLPPSKVVISIMAGLNSQFIRRELGGNARLVRAMPNTPCQIRAGMTAVALGEGAQPGDESLAINIFNSLGRTVIVDESKMYAVTAVSGSGPAYVFLFAEAMEQAAIELGLDQPTARVLVEQTVMGAGRLLSESNLKAEQLRHAVTSPGGTTAAALEVFDQRDFSAIVIQALKAARDRGIELDQH